MSNGCVMAGPTQIDTLSQPGHRKGSFARRASDKFSKDKAGMSAEAPSRKPTKKKGVFKRVFSFKRTTSDSAFQAPEHDVDEVVISPVFEHGMITDLGYNHPHNEDRGIIVEDLLARRRSDVEMEYEGTEDQAVTMFAVFDGHGGSSCSDYASKHLPTEVASLLYTSNYSTAIPSALHHSFKTVENDFCAKAKAAQDTAGSCATCVIIKGTKVYCGNAGDSKAMIFQEKGRGMRRFDLNERHSTELKSERSRIKAAKGTIAPDGSVYGVLFPTRGFGDIDVKSDRKPVIICTPTGAGIDEWQPLRLSTDSTSFLVVASDGLWDFVTDDEVERIIQRIKEPQVISEKLKLQARMGGSEDDITIITVKITYPDPTPQKRLSMVTE
eukprot:m.28845 g.28845  ORF g.28845 m.28845 type:complete len:383 (+) comp9081_c0_seq2:738-1886(+)